MNTKSIILHNPFDEMMIVIALLEEDQSKAFLSEVLTRLMNEQFDLNQKEIQVLY
jgi:hypothetical protein